ncbi:MAG: glycosyltransferase family 4 protein [Pseudomonadota bacterium]
MPGFKLAKIKIIHPITRLILGGAQQNTMETCAYLDQRRFEAQIIAGLETGAEGELLSEIRKRNIPVTIIPELVRRPDPVKDFVALNKMVQLFKAEQPHIVHTHSSKTGILGRWAARFARVPVIVHTVHGWGHHDYQNFLVKNLYKFLERRTVGFTDKLIVVSHLNTLKGLRDTIGTEEKYITIHSAINLDDFINPACDTVLLKRDLGIDPERPVVGTIGRLSPQKNPIDFVKVAAQVKKVIPDAQFLFIGDGPLRSATEALVKELGLAHDVFLPGLRTDIPALLSCMDVFMLTSLWEGLPRVIPQAMAMGLPVVANAVDGVCEVIEDGVNGFLMSPHAISRMAEKIIELLASANLRDEVGRQGRITAEKEFSVREMIKKIEDLYEALIKVKIKI